MSNLQHIAFIMDGNRRFAKRLMEKPWMGHEWGAKKVKEVLSWCREVGVKYVTFYTLSIENLNSRPAEELDMLMRIFRREFSKIPKDREVHKHQIRINVIGRLDLLPEDVQRVAYNAMEATKHHSRYVVNFAIAYGGRQEIIDAVKKIVTLAKNNGMTAEKIDEDLFNQFLYTNGTPDPDLIIRTSGEQRLSGFLLWQSAYSELYFTEQLWPEFTKEEFMRAVNEYKRRERRFGK